MHYLKVLLSFDVLGMLLYLFQNADYEKGFFFIPLNMDFLKDAYDGCLDMLCHHQTTTYAVFNGVKPRRVTM